MICSRDKLFICFGSIRQSIWNFFPKLLTLRCHNKHCGRSESVNRRLYLAQFRLSVTESFLGEHSPPIIRRAKDEIAFVTIDGKGQTVSGKINESALFFLGIERWIDSVTYAGDPK